MFAEELHTEWQAVRGEETARYDDGRKAGVRTQVIAPLVVQSAHGDVLSLHGHERQDERVELVFVHQFKRWGAEDRVVVERREDFLVVVEGGIKIGGLDDSRLDGDVARLGDHLIDGTDGGGGRKCGQVFVDRKGDLVVGRTGIDLSFDKFKPSENGIYHDGSGCFEIGDGLFGEGIAFNMFRSGAKHFAENADTRTLETILGDETRVGPIGNFSEAGLRGDVSGIVAGNDVENSGAVINITPHGSAIFLRWRTPHHARSRDESVARGETGGIAQSGRHYDGSARGAA